MTSIGIKGKKGKGLKTGRIALPGDPDLSKFNPNPKKKKLPKGFKTGPIALGEGSLSLPSAFPMKPDGSQFNPFPKPGKKPPKALKTGKIALPGDPDLSKFNRNPKPKKLPKGFKTGPIALGEGPLMLPSDFPMKPDGSQFNPFPKPGKKPPKALKTGPIALGEGPLVLPTDFNPIVQQPKMSSGLNRPNKPGAINTSGLDKLSKKGSLGKFAKKAGKSLKKYGPAVALSALSGISAGLENNKDGLGALRGIGQAASSALDMYAPGAQQAANSIFGFLNENVYSKILPKKKLGSSAYGRGRRSETQGSKLTREDRELLESTRNDRIQEALASSAPSESDQQNKLLNYLVASHMADKKKKK